MQHLPSVDEALIERYVRFPETLTKATRRLVSEHIEHHAWAREAAEFYRSFYDTFDGTEAPLARPAPVRRGPPAIDSTTRA